MKLVSLLFLLLTCIPSPALSQNKLAPLSVSSLPLGREVRGGLPARQALSLFPLPKGEGEQKQTPPTIQAPQLVRTTTRREVRRLGFGGSVSIVGAPASSISVEGWSRSEVEVSAEIQ